MKAGLGVLAGFWLLVSPAVAQEFFTLKGHGGPVKGIAVGADGTILTASFDNSVGLWRDGAPQWLEGHEAAVNAVLRMSGGQVVSAGDDFTVRLWDGMGSSTVLGKHTAKVIQLAASPEGLRVASASWDRTAKIWDPGGGTEPLVLEGHRNTVNDVAFSPDGARLYTAATDGVIIVWDATTGDQIRRFEQHGFGLNTIVLAADESWLSYGAVDGVTRVISLPEGETLYDFTAGRRPILAMDYHAQTDRIAVGDAEGYIMIVDTKDWRIADDFRATLSGPIWALAFAPDGQNIHAGGLDNAMYSWPVAALDRADKMTDTERSFLRDPSTMSNGERQFQRKCSICHALGPDGERRAGPTLYGLFGRPAGAVDGYLYSDTLNGADIVWSEETIDALFDVGPDHYTPGSKMPQQRIATQSDRDDLIAFLKESTN
ncbi:MAG: c-type cytochrome [Pseudomonadota bacterium]